MSKASIPGRRRLRRHLGRLAGCERGMAAVEFAFVGPMLTVLLLGISDVGWLALQRSDMHSAVRMGSQYLIAGGKNLSEAERIILASWSHAPAQASVSIVDFCRCGEEEHVCTAHCPDGSVPDAYTRLVVTAPLEGIFGREEKTYSDTIRVR